MHTLVSTLLSDNFLYQYKASWAGEALQNAKLFEDGLQNRDAQNLEEIV